MLYKGRPYFAPEIVISTLYLSISLGNKESTVQHLLSDSWLQRRQMKSHTDGKRMYQMVTNASFSILTYKQEK